MSEIRDRDELVLTVNRLMICAMEDIDCGRNEASPTTLDLVRRIEAHDAALRLALETATRERDEWKAQAETDAAWARKTIEERDALLSRPAPPADAAREAVPSMVALRGAIPDLVRGAVPDFPPYQTIPPEITARLDVAETALEEIIAESERWHDDGWTGAHVAFTALGGRKRRALSSPAPAPSADATREAVPRGFPPSLIREATEEAKTWLSAPYSNHGPQAVVDARGIMFRLLSVIHEFTAASVLSISGMHDTCDLCQRDIPDGCYAVFCGTCEDRLRAALSSPAPAPSAPAMRRVEVRG